MNDSLLLTANLQPASRWRLIVQCHYAVTAAILLGSLLAIPVLTMRIPTFSQISYFISKSPENDQALSDWGTAQPGSLLFQVSRNDGEILVRRERRGIAQPVSDRQVADQMRTLGYEIQGISQMSMGLSGGMSAIITDPITLASMLMGTQVGFLAVALYQMRKSKQRGESWSAFHTGSIGRALLLGLGAGVGLLAIGELYSFAVQLMFPQATSSAWASAQEMGTTGKFVFLSFGAIGAPISEELFFRRYLFGLFQRNKDVWCGILCSAYLFAGVHMSDPTNIPGILLFGIVLAWIYQKSGSLLAPIVAHAVNNAVAIGCLFSS